MKKNSVGDIKIKLQKANKMAEKKVKEIKAEKKVIATAGVYDVLRRPIISEKAAKLSESNAVAFEVAPKATKKDVANAIKAIYNVAPVKINMLVAKGKEKTFRGRHTGTQRAVKKAYVSLPADAKLDLAAEVK
jgi:large subunit ribosomal protein L23